MHRKLLILIVAMLPLFALAQMPKIYTKAGSGLNDEPLDVLRISTGKIYTTGYYSQLAFFGTQTVSLSGIDDAYIACQSTNGNYDWVCNLDPVSTKNTLLLQPGEYKVVYRQKQLKSTTFTTEKTVKIQSNKTTSINL